MDGIVFKMYAHAYSNLKFLFNILGNLLISFNGISVSSQNLLSDCINQSSLNLTKITDLVNGNMAVTQVNTTRTNFVSSKAPVNHTIAIKETDQDLLKDAAYNLVFWFIDCQYIGKTNSLTFFNNYTTENEKFEVEALLMASYVPVSQ